MPKKHLNKPHLTLRIFYDMVLYTLKWLLFKKEIPGAIPTGALSSPGELTESPDPLFWNTLALPTPF